MLVLAAALVIGAAPAPTVRQDYHSAWTLDFGTTQATPSAVTQVLKPKAADYYEALDQSVSAYWQARRDLGLVQPGERFIAPRAVVVRSSGSSSYSVRSQGGALTLEFPAEGNDPGPFTPEYRQLLIDTFAAAKPTMDVLFGQPFQGGTLRVYNMDNAIGDRDAVAGGLYLTDDGSGVPAIWFPVYLANETAVVNFIHCLFLAYLGPAIFDFDAWAEGFARAATMRTVLAGALPSGLDPDIVQSVILNSYDSSGHYSWHNQPALANSSFIAPNLRPIPLPVGGSLGGLFLMRYRMAGTAWAKVITEYPAFFSTFLASYYQDTSIRGNIPALSTLAQSTMNSLGGPGSTIEGRTFASWYRRQYVLDVKVARGRKTFVESIPITVGLGGEDFGVFAFWLSYFETLSGGNETLLQGTSYPIYWDATFARMFTSGQDDRMDIAGGFGSVTPNLPDVFGSGAVTQWYKAIVDIPVGDNLSRAIVPAGAIATAQDPTTKNFYGTVVGFDGAVAGGDPNTSGIVRLTLPGQAPVDAPLRNGAFGAIVPAPGLNAPKLARVDVVQVVSGNETILQTEFVNTWGDTLALAIQLDDEGSYFLPGGLAGGVQMVGFGARPYETDLAIVLGLPANETLVARWRQDRLAYDLYPALSGFAPGKGYMIRMPAAVPGFSVFGRLPGEQPYTVPLQVGWNQIVNPFPNDLPTTSVSVQRAADSPKTFSEAITAGWIDTQMFEFIPGANDPFSGLPEGGTMSPLSSFPAGKALFVRALAPEGVTITFRPDVFGAAAAPGGGGVPFGSWTAKLVATGLGVERSEVEFGQRIGAKDGYDVGIDCGLPPVWGGALQAMIRSGGTMYRDVRPHGINSWDVRLSGLRAGFTYTIRFEEVIGGILPYQLTFTDLTARRTLEVRRTTTYQFVANAPQRDFRVRSRY